MKHKKTTNKVTQCEDGNPDCFHGGKAACTWCGTNNWDFNPKYNKNYCNRCGYAEDYPKSKCGQCGETIYRSSHTCSKAPPEPVEDWQPAWEKLKCKTTSASIIGFENDADIKFIRNLLAQERERQRKIDAEKVQSTMQKTPEGGTEILVLACNAARAEARALILNKES